MIIEIFNANFLSDITARSITSLPESTDSLLCDR